ncbi:MAG: ABC transporter ATP-binding protein [Candidatus Bathyarchaeota archaeon]|nr:MAG: ABC transporter ATP-binding protein [Candidatus Bathyarchaeota archaeon]
MELVCTNELVKSFGNTVALDGLNLRFPKGISGFIGKNGAGKTTTISVLLGLIKPNSGEATVFGLDCWRDSSKIKPRLGVMHEVNAYPNNFSANQFLKHVAHIYGVTQVNKQVKKTLTDVGLVDVRNKKIETYSAGMFRRLGLAQALIGDPELAILDEPTANIDPLGRIKLLEIITNLHKDRNTSFIISTHILSDLEKVCNWLSIIDKGKIVDQGNIKDLADKYSANIFKVNVSNPDLFVKEVKVLEYVEKVWVENAILYCKVNNSEKFYEDIPKIAVDLKLQLKSFQQMFGTLEEIFTKTTKGK